MSDGGAIASPLLAIDYPLPLTSLKTHNLDILLRLSGVEEKIKTNYMVDWSIVASWDPQLRYNPVGSARSTDVRNMLVSSKTLLRVL